MGPSGAAGIPSLVLMLAGIRHHLIPACHAASLAGG